MGFSPRRFWNAIRRSQANKKRHRATGAGRQPLELLEGRAMLSVIVNTPAYTGPVIHSIDYSPTWPHWSSFDPKDRDNPLYQLNDSDFANNAFAGLWGTTRSGAGRNDLKAIQDGGYNSIRLYNWGPTRGWNGKYGTGHRNFLREASVRGLKVIVPVSNYFLSNQLYAWDGKNPDANFSFASAPRPIQEALVNFARSLSQSIDFNGNTVTSAQIEPAVFMVDVGNEIDLKLNAGGPEPNATAKLERAMWWVVNLQDQLSKLYPTAASHPLLSIGISNADQNNDSASKLSWFQAFAGGVKAGEKTPFSPPEDRGVNGDTFTENVKGLEPYPWYTTWFVNTVNIFQFENNQLYNTLQQYDTGVPTGSTWSTTWPGTPPGQQPNTPFPVPLLLTETGISRTGRGEDLQFSIVTSMAQQAESYLAASTNHHIMGYTIFGYNDEPNFTNHTNPLPFNDATFGIFKYYNTTNINDFRTGQISEELDTGVSPVSFGEMPDLRYPVYKLFPVTSNGISLYDKLKTIMAASK